jgi:hypothetical protein
MTPSQWPWAEPLNVSHEQIIHWQQAAGEADLLPWLLQNGHLDVPSYLDWAKEFYNLPVLQSSYFYSTEFDGNFLKSQLTAATTASFGPWRLPVAGWENQIYVACVEPLSPVPAGWVQLLCDPRALAEVVAMIPANGAETPMAEEPAIIADAPMAIDPPPFVLNLDENTIFGERPSEPASTLTTEFKAAPTDSPTAAAAAEPRTEPPPPEPYAVSVTENLAEPATERTIEPTVVAKPIKPSPAVAPKAPAAPITALSPALKATCQQVFARIGLVYKHALLVKWASPRFQVVEQGSTWGGDLKGSTVPEDQPSFLRIVLKTRLPYHGHLVASPLHKDLMTTWGFSELPGCVTAVPILIESQLWGILVGVGDESHQSMNPLKMVEGQALVLRDALSGEQKQAA